MSRSIKARLVRYFHVIIKITILYDASSRRISSSGLLLLIRNKIGALFHAENSFVMTQNFSDSYVREKSV